MGNTAYLVLPVANMSSALATIEDAEREAGKAVDKDRTARVIVQVISLVKPRMAPNVDVVRYEGAEADHG